MKRKNDIMFASDIPVAKEPFEFEYTVPCLDWYKIKKVVLQSSDYYYFRLERRYGPTWWLIGMNTVDEPAYHWEETQIGEIYERDLKRFIEWAKQDYGSKLINIKAISGSFDILEEIKKLINN